MGKKVSEKQIKIYIPLIFIDLILFFEAEEATFLGAL